MPSNNYRASSGAYNRSRYLNPDYDALLERYSATIPHRERNQVLGEIIHHLRSSLDHIAWLLSSEKYRREHETAIAFPICTDEPIEKKELA